MTGITSIGGDLVATASMTRTKSAALAQEADSTGATFQQIAARYDVRKLTHGQAQNLVSDLVNSGTISPQRAVSTLIGGLGLLHLLQPEPDGAVKSINSDGTDPNAAGQPFDAVARFQGIEAFDASQGLTRNATEDQANVDLLDSLDRLHHQIPGT